MSLAVIGAAGTPSGPKMWPAVIHRPISASSGRYSGPVRVDCLNLPAASSPSLLSMACSFAFDSRCAEPACLGWADVSDLGQPAHGVSERFLERARLDAELAPGLRVIA